MTQAALEEPAAPARWGVRFLRAFQIDIRSLAAMRIVLGMTILYDLSQRARFLKIFYTDWGVAPRALVMPDVTGRLSLYAISGSYAWVMAVLIAHLAFAVMFTIAYRTRVATAALFVLLYSLINRNPSMTNGGDNLELWLLFWSVFLPLGAIASVDSINAHFNRKSLGLRRIYTVASAGILLQVAFVYWSAVTAKHDAKWVSEFTAVHYFLHGHWATPLGFRVGEISALMQPMTFMTMALELMGPVVALISWDMPRVRTIIALVFISFHLGLTATMYVGTFSFICIAGWILFLPAEFWDTFLDLSPLRLLASAWRRIVAAAASALSCAPQRHVASLKLRPTTRTVLILILGYLMLVNFVSDLPPRIRGFVGPVARLPKLKQSWSVMDVPTQFFNLLQLEVHLANGQIVELSGNDPRTPIFKWTLPPNSTAEDSWNRSLFPMEMSPLLEYRTTMLQGALIAPSRQIKRYCEFHRLRWNESHPDPGEKVTEISAYCVYKQVSPLDGDPTRAALAGRQLEYSWPSGASAGNPSGDTPAPHD